MRKIFWFFIFVVCGQPIWAGPDETTNFLMNEPVSLMDIGIIRLNLALQSGADGHASYNWDENRIKIVAPYQHVTEPSATEDAAEKACANWLTEVRTQFLVIPETGEPFLGSTSLASDYFRHQGYLNTNAPETLYEDLDKLIIFECTARYSEGVVKITGSLVSKGYSVAKE